MAEPVDARHVYVDPSKVRSEDQLQEYERIFDAGVCPFCLEYREEYTQGTRLHDGPHWWLFQNNWPYKNTRRHIMAVLREHGIYMEDVPSGSGDELFAQLAKIEKEDGYTLAAIEARYGFVILTGASVAHLHLHLLIPDVKDKPDTYIESYTFGKKVWGDEHWQVYENAQPDPLARVHMLVVSKKPAMYMRDLEKDSGEYLFANLRKIEEVYEFTHGGIHARLGARLQKGDAVGHVVFEVIAPRDEVADDPNKKLRKIVSQRPLVEFKIST